MAHFVPRRRVPTALLALSHCRCPEDRIKIRDCRTKCANRKLPSKLQQFIRCDREKFIECNGIKFVINQWKGTTEQVEINTSRSKGSQPDGGRLLLEEILDGGTMCRPFLQILTLFQTQKCHFPHPFSDQTSKIYARFQAEIMSSLLSLMPQSANKKFFQSISNLHISLSFLLKWN